MNNPIIWLGVGIGVILIILVAVYTLAGGVEPAAMRRGWRDLAERTGMDYTPPDKTVDRATVKGSYRRRSMVLGIRLRAVFGGREGQTNLYTYVGARVGNHGYLLHLRRRGVFRRTDRFLNTANTEFGDRELDRRYEVKSSPPSFLPEIVKTHIKLREQLLRLRERGSLEMELDGDTLRFESEGLETDPRYLHDLFDMLCDLAEMVERKAPK